MKVSSDRTWSAVALAPAGSTDIVARIVAQKLTAALGQPAIDDRRISSARRGKPLFPSVRSPAAEWQP